MSNFRLRQFFINIKMYVLFLYLISYHFKFNLNPFLVLLEESKLFTWHSFVYFGPENSIPRLQKTVKAEKYEKVKYIIWNQITHRSFVLIVRMPRLDPSFLEELDIVARETRANIPRCQRRCYGNLIALMIQVAASGLAVACITVPYWVENNSYNTTIYTNTGVDEDYIRLGLFAICQYGNFSSLQGGEGCRKYTFEIPEWVNWARSMALFGIQCGNVTFALYLALFITSSKFNITHTSIYISSNVFMFTQVGLIFGCLFLFARRHRSICNDVFAVIGDGSYHLTWGYYFGWWSFLLLIVAMYIQWADFATKLKARDLELQDDEFEIDDGYLILKSAY
ncbi:uncharacterized protein LOC142339898 isoform X3 [Convolutriloba macropyga]|uniref:uncharacterized protein LOC142339898 isoform X3 n=1 Tax=Convolutriloba macropyga TaxID=536237 RepID=UPI003F5227C2